MCMNHRTMRLQHHLDCHNNTTYSSIDCQYVMDCYNPIYDNIEQDVDHLKNTNRLQIKEKNQLFTLRILTRFTSIASSTCTGIWSSALTVDTSDCTDRLIAWCTCPSIATNVFLHLATRNKNDLIGYKNQKNLPLIRA